MIWKNIVFICVIFSLNFCDVKSSCCLQKEVSTGTGDDRDGVYNFNTTSSTLPAFCGDECVYTKEGSEEIFCFGTGDIDSVCLAAGATDPPAPDAAPDISSDDDKIFVPSGEYYYNQLPGTVTRAVECGETISMLTEDRMTKLDLSAMSSLVAADYEAWSSTKLVFDRIDGPSDGEVMFDHLVGIFATNDAGAMFRLKIAGDTLPSADTATTKLLVKSGDGTSCSGNVNYGVEYSVFTSDGVNRLDIGTLGAGSPTTWDVNSVETRIHIDPLA